MIPLSNITGLSAEIAELLSAAGVRSAGHLALEDPVRLQQRLEMLAWQRGRAALTPQTSHLEQWIALARMITPPEEAQQLSMEDIPEAVTSAPPAAWMPPAIRAAQEASGAAPQTARPAAQGADNTWRHVDPSRFATIEEYNEGRIAVKPLSRESMHSAPAAEEGLNDDEVDPLELSPRRALRIRSTGEELSRWIRRGVVHPRPVHTWLGALVSIVWRIAFIAGVIGFVVLITQVERPADYKTEVIIGSAILVILGCMQIHFAGRSRCRICSCNLYYSKNCLKNRKAHRIPLFGYVASTALHLLIFGWFRCMYCGTAIRLKPGRN
jgi:hypothetical protein